LEDSRLYLVKRPVKQHVQFAKIKPRNSDLVKVKVCEVGQLNATLERTNAGEMEANSQAIWDLTLSNDMITVKL
jgi:hypothetical protein